MLTRLLNWLAAWARELRYRINYREGEHFARVLLAEGWPAADLFALDSGSMPNDAYRDGFFDALLKETRHA